MFARGNMRPSCVRPCHAYNPRGLNKYIFPFLEFERIGSKLKLFFVVYREKVKIHRNSVETNQKRVLANSRSRHTWVSPARAAAATCHGYLRPEYINTNDSDHKSALKFLDR